MNVTFVNYSGERMTLPGRVGDSLYALARRFKYEDVDRELLHCRYVRYAAYCVCTLTLARQHAFSTVPLHPCLQPDAAVAVHQRKLCTRRAGGTSPSTEKEPLATSAT